MSRSSPWRGVERAVSWATGRCRRCGRTSSAWIARYVMSTSHHRKSVTGRGLVGVVVIVPAFAVSQQRDPPQVRRPVASRVRAITPDVARGIDQPGRMEHEDRPDEPAPDQPAHAADRVQRRQTARAETQSGIARASDGPGLCRGQGTISGRTRECAPSLRPTIIHQYMCAQKKPRSGVCVSSSSSEWAWCLRWSATQPIGPPSEAHAPMMVNTYSSHLGRSAKLR